MEGRLDGVRANPGSPGRRKVTGASRFGRPTKDFRSKRYRAACAKFGQAAKLAPDDGAIAADLGLCLAKLGDDEGARAANLRAIVHGDLNTRVNAYYNLGALGNRVVVPEAGGCAEVQSTVSGCDRSVHACAYEWQAEGNESWDGITLRVAADGVAAAPRPADDHVDPFEIDSTNQRPRVSVIAGRAIDVLLEQSVRFLGAMMEGIARADAANAAEDGRQPTAVEEMYAFATRNSAMCRVVALDGCRGRLGLVCEQDEKKKWATEVDLAPALGQSR